METVTAFQMQEIDRQAHERFGIPELILMEHAGTAMARVAHRWFTRLQGKQGPLLLLAGGGANGGDGFVVARHLDNWGVPIHVVLVADPARISGAAQINLNILQRLKIPLTVVRSLAMWNAWTGKRHPARLAVDALLGTGVMGQVREPILSVIRWLNRQRFPVLSMDIPSGLSADTGFPCPEAVKATVTVTCGLRKQGLREGKGPSLVGRVIVADISLPRILRQTP